MQGSLLQILCSKLLAVRRGIQGWNKQFLGNIFDAVREAEVGLLRAEDDVANDDSEGHRLSYKRPRRSFDGL